MPSPLAVLEKDFLQELPCEPANILAIANLLENKTTALHHLIPFFEQDLVLCLKSIARANEVMLQHSRRALDIRSVGHALTILGFDGVRELVYQCRVCNPVRNSISFQLHRYTLARAQLLLQFGQALAPFHPALNVDDIRLYVSLLTMGELTLVRERPEESQLLFFLHQYELADFWVAEIVLLNTTFIDISLQLSKRYTLPENIQQSLQRLPGLDQFFFSGKGLDVKKIASLLRTKMHEQDIVPILILCCYALVHRPAAFWGDKTTTFIIHWLARFLHQDVSHIWVILQQQIVRASKTYPLLSRLGQGLLAQDWPAPLSENELLERVKPYTTIDGFGVVESTLDITQARRLPRMEALAQAKIMTQAKIMSLAQNQSEKSTAQPTAKNNLSKLNIDERQPGKTIDRFIATMKTDPQAFGEHLPTIASLLEALRVGLAAKCCLALSFDQQNNYIYVSALSGLASRHPLRQWRVPLDYSGMLKNFLMKPAGMWVDDKKRASVAKAVPKILQEIFGDNQVMLTSVLNKQRQPIGVVIAIAQTDEDFSQSCYIAFQKAVLSTAS